MKNSKFKPQNSGGQLHKPLYNDALEMTLDGEGNAMAWFEWMCQHGYSDIVHDAFELIEATNGIATAAGHTCSLTECFKEGNEWFTEHPEDLFN